jgi:CDP-diacylglycerol--glycerol-3-phosphate 3-phosphatidyltransferase
LFILASSTDYWDGYLARKFNLNSIFGEVLDPIADKILITFIIISLTLELSSEFVGFVGGIMLIREFWVSALRDFNAREGRSKATVVTFFAKIKTAVQLITFSLFLLGLFLQNALLIFLANFFLFLALIITIQTGLSYTIATFKK